MIHAESAEVPRRFGPEADRGRIAVHLRGQPPHQLLSAGGEVLAAGLEARGDVFGVALLRLRRKLLHVRIVPHSPGDRGIEVDAMMPRSALLALAAAGSALCAPIAADSARGARLFETLSCVQCHSIGGKGGKVG